MGSMSLAVGWGISVFFRLLPFPSFHRHLFLKLPFAVHHLSNLHRPLFPSTFSIQPKLSHIHRLWTTQHLQRQRNRCANLHRSQCTRRTPRLHNSIFFAHFPCKHNPNSTRLGGYLRSRSTFMRRSFSASRACNEAISCFSICKF